LSFFLIFVRNNFKNMKKRIKTIIILLAAVVLADSCSTVPLTGRRQLSLIPESELIAMSLTSYSDFLKENPLSTNRTNTTLVQDVGKNISNAVVRYFSANNMSASLNGYQWEFNLIEDSTPNAWAMPGGKVVVYTGLLPYTQDANGLAVVVSHEIAHAVARHGSERMSQQLLAQFGSVALGEALRNKPEQTQVIFGTAFGLGTQLGVMLPYSRQHELEADRLGLIFMAMAGYNPQTAVTFWTRMASMGGEKPPEFLSTHPSDATRIQNIQRVMPEALSYYK
jgi:predicted Zn-dependent protease